MNLEINLTKQEQLELAYNVSKVKKVRYLWEYLAFFIVILM